MRKSTWAIVLAVWCGTASVASGDAMGSLGPIESEGLGLPLVCRLGETCWVANYVDVDLTDAASDFRCKSRSYNAHDGTDFAIRDLAVMQQGVPVVASAQGTVRRVRDGVEDAVITDQTSRTRIAGRECGNGVVIDHAGGWQTQYCHLRRGSIRVRIGDQVPTGSPLGLVGLSGKTEFPHVHLTVRHDGQVVDPFTGQLQRAGCGLAEKSLWRADAHVSYEDVALYNAGFSAGQPDVETIRRGRVPDQPLSPTSPALILWVDVFGVQSGDRIRFRITGPDGTDGRVILDKEERVDRTQARRFVFAGQRRRTDAWSPGTYAGQVTLSRMVDGYEIERSSNRSITVQ
jgi:murein DD-endopeptidase MepM/ murein hydrolase activator NlpD